jgi:hypothetical protein
MHVAITSSSKNCESQILISRQNKYVFTHLLLQHTMSRIVMSQRYGGHSIHNCNITQRLKLPN